MDNALICKRLEFLKTDRKNVEDLWEDIERFVVPFRGEFFRDMGTEGEVDWRKSKIYDSTAITAAQGLAASMQSNIMNPASQWFLMNFRDKEIQNDDDAREWLEEVTSLIYYALIESNMDAASAEMFTDMVGFGPAVIIEEWDPTDKKLIFTSVPIREAFFEEGFDGSCKNLYRKMMWTAVQIHDKFVKGDYKKENLPQKVQDQLEKPDAGSKRFEVIFCVYTRLDKMDNRGQDMLGVTERIVGSKYIFKDTQDTLGDENGYYDMPVFIPGWRKVAGSRWAHSPSAVALADIMSLNELMETTLEAGAKAIDPAILTTQRGLMSDMDLGRGGLTVLRDVDALKAFDTGSNWQANDLIFQRLVTSINRTFYVDQLELKESPAMTATEVQVRYELMQRLLGPTLGSIQRDYLDKLIERTFGILQREGMLPEPPASVGGDIDIEYTGPMARSHRQAEAIATQKWIEGLVQYASVDPEVLDVVDTEEMPIQMGITGGVPATMMRSKKEIQAKRKERAEQQEQAREMEMAQMEAQTNKTGAEAENVGNNLQ